ncbi:MAG: FtsX-like permease family protein [Armatimonadetes bacterium]|nr:FtsX-like permease family protein [Armatimonadota bacterium]
MFLRLLLGSLIRRKDRALLCLASLTTACALAGAMVHVAADSEAKARHELRAYGANLTLVPRAAPTAGALPAAGLTGAEVAAFRRLAGPRLQASSGARYLVARAGEQPVALGGIDWRAAPRLFPYWRWDSGGWPTQPDECALGTRAAAALRSQVGSRLKLKGPAGNQQFRVAAILRAGDAADGQVFVALEAAQRLAAGNEVTVVLATVHGDARAVEGLAREVEAALPGVRAEPARPLAAAEAALLPRLRGLMLAVCVLVFAIAGLTAASTLAGAVLDRQREMALMKALGAEDGAVARLFAVEAVLLGVVAGLLGAGLGLLGAQALMHGLFGLDATFRPLVVPLSLALGICAAAVAAWLPACRVARLEPSTALRSE